MMWFNIAKAQSFMPTQGTEIAKQVDNLYGFLLVTSLIACVLVIGGMIYFVWKYRRKSPNDKTAYISHNTALEFLWSFIPLVIFLAVFGWGWYIYHQMRAMPENALEINVIGKQWAWEVEYKNGYKTVNEVVVPINQDVKILLTAADVLHSFYVPSFRIKQDAIPGRYTALWFKADKLGEFHLFCTEYCGTSHSGMIGKLRVVSREDFDKYLEQGQEERFLPLAEKGKKLFAVKACASCHAVDHPGAMVGPSLFQKFGHEEVMDDGTKIMFDENYIRESILEPNKHIVKGFPKGVMPTFQGQLNENELSALVEYVKNLK
ncbi:cytochrome c oxidase subunit II [Bdellovibrio bacteriovorus]|uniref:Cytochrome c oxidase subunit 2 n=1 Tax=Bdellovibrio bacteriovorus str. Tiberius TaxID=1069642 RepID=K7YTS1_BDEBC|nr:cytochrome c oxidase subunit II [Bdellovibrio bacteriovorus]AFX99989.1 cytochrome c oxidase, subunit II [Bdellovibrio bacteriovorus str. Tiberius]